MAQQRTLILKLKQAIGELLNKRDHFLVAVSEREEGFQLREAAAKEQVSAPPVQRPAFPSRRTQANSPVTGCLTRRIRPQVTALKEQLRAVIASSEERQMGAEVRWPHCSDGRLMMAAGGARAFGGG